jgi:glycosyltransferase involved in cell wall biosynthesis
MNVILGEVVTVIVPAHNEARVLGRLLGQIVSGAGPGDLDVIVEANGCTDDTAQIAVGYGPMIRAISIPVPSKREALTVGDQAATGFPRLYVDADVELGYSDIRTLELALQRPGVLAVAPQRVLALNGRPRLVRWYYELWARLPEVRNGLFGRGVIGVSAAGYARIAALPPLLADDLAVSLAFAPDERLIVEEARAVVHVPRTLGDLLRRRVRAETGVAQVERTEGAPPSTARTRPSDLMSIVVHEPRMAPHVLLFLAVAVVARSRSRRAMRKQDLTWLRDESSRQ